MGQHNSVNMPKRLKLKSFRPSFTRRSSNNNISATFTIIDDEHKVELLNVNLATEEELMTLPEINRAIARNIVEHRKAIGRFKKIEDLALVRGVGADKLDQIRPEICVNRLKSQSCNSSRAQSVDSLDSRLTNRISKTIDINKANVFELQSVNGLTQELAANIVEYRRKKGAFKSLDDIIKVKGINRIILSNVRAQLSIGEVEELKKSVNEVLPINGVRNGGLYSASLTYKKSSSLPANFSLCNGLSASSVSDIFELLSAYSYRPIPEEDFSYRRNGETAFRIASWNLQNFTIDKAQNLGVKEVICRTILENQWSIIAVQEIEEHESLKIICDALNKPYLRRIAEWKNNSRQWSFCIPNETHSRLGFIYDSSNEDISVSLNVMDQTSIVSHQVLSAEFKVNDNSVTILNTYFTETNLHDMRDKISDIILKLAAPFFVVGDFISLSKNTSDESIELPNLKPVLPLSINTHFLSTKSNVKSRYVDNILTDVKGLSQFTGVWGVVRQGLTHLAIPCGWNWGGPISTHCPVWTELYASPNIGTML